MALFRRFYGGTPLHLLTTIAALALAAYALGRIFDGAQASNVMLWFIGAIVAHDMIAFPLYTALDRLSQRLARGRSGVLRRVPVVNHVRVPAIFAGITFVVFLPLILGIDKAVYESQTSLDQGVYLERWLLICGGLFVVSAVLYAIRSGRAPRSAGGEQLGERERETG